MPNDMQLETRLAPDLAPVLAPDPPTWRILQLLIRIQPCLPSWKMLARSSPSSVVIRPQHRTPLGDLRSEEVLSVP